MEDPSIFICSKIYACSKIMEGKGIEGKVIDNSVSNVFA